MLTPKREMYLHPPPGAWREKDSSMDRGRPGATDRKGQLVPWPVPLHYTLPYGSASTEPGPGQAGVDRHFWTGLYIKWHHTLLLNAKPTPAIMQFKCEIHHLNSTWNLNAQHTTWFHFLFIHVHMRYTAHWEFAHWRADVRYFVSQYFECICAAFHIDFSSKCCYCPSLSF